MTLSEAIAVSTAVTRRRSSTFSLGTRFLPRTQRDAAVAVYAACRAGDDAVDQEPNPIEATRRLQTWWAGVERAYAGQPDPDTAFEVALAWAVRRFPVPLEAFEELRWGLRTDIGEAELQELDDLMLYCRRVAGVVGLMVAPIVGYRGGAETLRAAVALGQAMQLTNVLRDVGEDLRLGRCYLPKSLRREYGVELDELATGRVGYGYVSLLERVGEDAHALYRHGWRGIPRLHGMSRLAVAVAALNYEAILHKLRQNRYDNLTKRAHLRPHERVFLIPRAVIGAAAGAVIGAAAGAAPAPGAERA
jgi:15-cis-phytoene synthase